MEYIDAHPELQWKTCGLSKNPNLTIDYVCKNKNKKKWDWKEVSKNPGINLHDIENNLYLPWRWSHVAQNPNMTLNFLLKHLDDLKNNANECAASKHITLEEIEKHPELFNRNQYISRNPNLTLEYVFDHVVIDRLWQHDWDWVSIGRNINITFQDVLRNSIKHPALLRNWSFMAGLSSNPNITLDIVLDNLNYCWNYSNMSSNSSFTMQDIELLYTIEKIEDLSHLSWNPNITTEYILDHPEIDWSFKTLSGNQFLYHPSFGEPIIIRI